MIVFLAEASTPFLHLSWALHKMNYSSSVYFLICAATLLLLFFVFRVLLSAGMLFHLTVHRAEWGSGLVNQSIFAVNYVVVALFALLNYYWFYKLLVMAIGRRKKKADE